MSSGVLNGLSLNNTERVVCDSIFLKSQNTIIDIYDIFLTQADASTIIGFDSTTITILQQIVNSIGASILIELIEQLQDIDGQLVFCDLAPIIEKTFKIMGLTKYCKVYPTEDEAVKELA